MLFAESPVKPDDPPQRPNELMRERGRLVKQGVSLAQGMKHMMLEYLALQYVTEEGESSLLGAAVELLCCQLGRECVACSLLWQV
jgi:hypothetical protein